METITEAMLAVLVDAGAVKTVRLTEGKGTGKLKRKAWAITVQLELSRVEQNVLNLFYAENCPTPLPTQRHAIHHLAKWADRVIKGNLVWAELVTRRELVSPVGEPRTVVSLDRYINHLRELGARKVSIEIHLEEKP